MALVGFKAGPLVEVKRNFANEVIGSYDRSAHDNWYTAIDNLSTDIPYCLMQPRYFIKES